MNIFKYTFVASVLMYLGAGAAAVHAMNADHQPTINSSSAVSVMFHDTANHNDFKNTLPPFNPFGHIVFRHGDISWLPQIAAMAGWPEDTWYTLGRIILRESGGCPNRRGGDIVDEDCNIIGHDGSNHASDTGLMQINGVNYNMKRNEWAGVCRDLGICSQELLFNPVTNLRAGKYLYDRAGGWGPWDPCSWGPEYKKQCKLSQKPQDL